MVPLGSLTHDPAEDTLQPMNRLIPCDVMMHERVTHLRQGPSYNGLENKFAEAAWSRV